MQILLPVHLRYCLKRVQENHLQSRMMGHGNFYSTSLKLNRLLTFTQTSNVAHTLQKMTLLLHKSSSQMKAKIPMETEYLMRTTDARTATVSQMDGHHRLQATKTKTDAMTFRKIQMMTTMVLGTTTTFALLPLGGLASPTQTMIQMVAMTLMKMMTMITMESSTWMIYARGDSSAGVQAPSVIGTAMVARILMKIWMMTTMDWMMKWIHVRRD